MISPIFMLIIHFMILPLILVFCGGKKAPQSARNSFKGSSKKESTPVASDGGQAAGEQEGSKDAAGDKTAAAAGGGEGAPRKDDNGPVVLDVGSEFIDILLNQLDGTITEEYYRSMADLEDKAMQYMWGMKKRLAADEASWKELSKKITKLLAEGFTVRAGSEEAKRLRRLGEVENRVEQQLQQNKKGRKKSTAKGNKEGT